jgi:hypothetical protein
MPQAAFVISRSMNKSIRYIVYTVSILRLLHQVDDLADL